MSINRTDLRLLAGEVPYMAKTVGDVLTIEDLSGYLKIPKSTLYKLVREGKIPCQKIGRHWRFHKETVDHWLQARSQTVGGKA